MQERHTVHIRVVAEWPRCDESVNRPRTQRHTRVDRPTVTRHGRVITGRDGCGFHADTARLQPATSKASAVSHTHPTRTHIPTTCARGPPPPRHTSPAGGPGSRAVESGGRRPPTRCRLRRTYPGQARRPATVPYSEVIRHLSADIRVLFPGRVYSRFFCYKRITRIKARVKV